MKKFISVLLSLTLIIGLAACGKNEEKTTTTAPASVTSAQTTSIRMSLVVECRSV